MSYVDYYLVPIYYMYKRESLDSLAHTAAYVRNTYLPTYLPAIYSFWVPYRYTR